MAKEPENKSEIILYQTADDGTRVECRFEDQNVWLTQDERGQPTNHKEL